MKKSSVLFVLMAASGICFSSVYAQKRLVLDLNQTIALANDSSLESFRTQNMYLSGYWEYRTYRANRLPSLTMDLTPAQYNRISRNVMIRDRTWMSTVRNSHIMPMED